MTDFAAVDANLRECFRALASGREHGEMRQVGGVEMLSLGVLFQMFNAAYLAYPVSDEADFEQRVATAAVHFGARGVPWSFWLCDGMLPEAAVRRAPRILSRRGLRLATQMPGMATARLQPAVREFPPCDFRQVRTPAVLADFCSIGSQCFRVPPHWFAEVFDARTADRSPFRAWVGYAGAKPVSTAATVRMPESVGIYNVATLPQFRNLGYAEAAMRHAIDWEWGQEEGTPLVLQATVSGLHLYERMGFETVTRFRVWVS